MSHPEKQIGALSYIADLVYGATKYPSGWIKPSVVRGFFTDTRKGELQQIFFDALIQAEFKRTYWQLMFPGQTAGLVRKQKVEPSKPNEHHVRFYNDGVIDCELEFDRFHRSHWTGERHSGIDFLHEFLDKSVKGITSDTKSEIGELFQKKNFTQQCVRNGFSKP
ncbi:hypothetical protein H6770_04505 [Candidatus Peribacteria bacterium]|nr:hypothetical protein [Candidatus Peribacteria bacterium]